MQAEIRLDNKRKEVQEVLAEIDQVKIEMDINIPPPAVPPVQEPGEIDEEESPACDEMDDDAFLGLNYQHFPDMEVGEGGQILLPALTQLFMHFLPSMLIKFSSLDTKVAASQLCG